MQARSDPDRAWQQSKFFAVGSFAVLAVYLRQRGSSESKPVGAPHLQTGTEGATRLDLPPDLAGASAI